MELGLHIADFTMTGGASVLGPALARHARDAEAAGVTRITVMDHFWQLGGDLGPYENEMLEAYTVLGFLAAHTERVLLHTLVTGVVYHEPAVLAKKVTTLDVLSGGRGALGIGAAWNADESKGLGIPFPDTKERFERLEETLKICLQMWSGDEAPYAGAHYTLDRPLNSPQSLSRPHPYLMIGGSGEKKTLRLVARYADACNIFAGPEAARKLEVLKEHCAAVGRDYDDIEKTTTFALGPDTTPDDLTAQAQAMAELGFTAAYVYSQQIREPARVVDLLTAVVPRIA